MAFEDIIKLFILLFEEKYRLLNTGNSYQARHAEHCKPGILEEAYIFCTKK